MRSSLASITIGIVLSSWLASARAQTYVSLGYGGVSCATWSSRKAIEGKAYEAWMLGFISSYNAYVFSGPNVVAGLELDDLRKWVDDYCKEHVQDSTRLCGCSLTSMQRKIPKRLAELGLKLHSLHG